MPLKCLQCHYKERRVEKRREEEGWVREGESRAEERGETEQSVREGRSGGEEIGRRGAGQWRGEEGHVSGGSTVETVATSKCRKCQNAFLLNHRVSMCSAL